jgi:hypothetical protein
MVEPIFVVEHDPQWVRLFEEERARGKNERRGVCSLGARNSRGGFCNMRRFTETSLQQQSPIRQRDDFFFPHAFARQEARQN